MTEKMSGSQAMTEKKSTDIIMQHCNVRPVLIIREHKTYFRFAKVGAFRNHKRIL